MRARGFSGRGFSFPFTTGLVPLAADVRHATREAYGLRGRAFVYVGRLVPEKGVDLMLSAMAPIPGVQALIVGEGPERATLVALAEKLGITSRVRFTGVLPPDDAARAPILTYVVDTFNLGAKLLFFELFAVFVVVVLPIAWLTHRSSNGRFSKFAPTSRYVRQGACPERRLQPPKSGTFTELDWRVRSETSRHAGCPRADPSVPPAPAFIGSRLIMMLDAFQLAAVGTPENLQRAIALAPPAEAKLLRAVIAQTEGDVDGAVRILRQLMTTLQGSDRAAVADCLAPIYVMRNENAAVMRLADVIQKGGWIASALAFRALANSKVGNREAARRQASASAAALGREGNDIMRARVLQRLALANYYLNDHERALNLALSGAQLFSKVGAWRGVAASYSIAYNVHANVSGDFEEAARYAQLWYRAALQARDETSAQLARVAEYELAVLFAEGPRAESLERAIKASLLPELFSEQFPFALSYALVRGANDLGQMRTLLQTLRELRGRSRGEWALCTALIAVCEAADADDESATCNVREAIARLGRQRSSDAAGEQTYRRLARATVAVTRVLLGNEALAARTVEAGESQQGLGERSLALLMQTGRLNAAPKWLRGFARVFVQAQARRAGLVPPAGLTHAELEVLRLLARGWSGVKIARETRRSVNTVYSHTRALLTKLEASRASEAVALARARGFIP